MTLVISPGSGRPPVIARPTGLSATARRATIHVGQQLTLTSGSRVSFTGAGCSGCVVEIPLAGSRVLVGTRPGTARLTLKSAERAAPLTVRVQP
jgi:hypothetical protein